MRASSLYVKGVRETLRNAEECRTDAQAAGMHHLLTFAVRDRIAAVSMLEKLADTYREEGKYPLTLKVTEMLIAKQKSKITEEEAELKNQSELTTAEATG